MHVLFPLVVIVSSSWHSISTAGDASFIRDPNYGVQFEKYAGIAEFLILFTPLEAHVHLPPFQWAAAQIDFVYQCIEFWVLAAMTDKQLARQLIDAQKSVTPAINQLRVLQLLRRHGSLSRVDIARHAKITKATASRIVAALQSLNLVREVGVRSLSRGRRPVLYEFNTASAIALGIEIRQNECQAVVTELDATPLRSDTYPLTDTRVSTFLDVLSEAVRVVQQNFPQRLVGIGIGIPGVYDHQKDVVVLAERLQWANVELARLVAEQLPLNVYIANRANAAALGEKWYGAGRNCENLVFINIGSGIKAGIIIDGELYLGSNGSAGEIGHMTIAPDGPLCVCGKRGCLEALASTNAIVERIRFLARAGRVPALSPRLQHAIDSLTRQDLTELAQSGGPAALEAFREAGNYIGIAVANVINMFNPERVILGGVIRQAPPIFLEAIRLAAQAHTFEIPWRAVEIVESELSTDAVAIGAAALMLSRFLAPAPDHLLLVQPESHLGLPVNP